MKKKSLIFIMTFCLVIPCMLMLAGCAHEHTFETTWSFNNTHHWHASTCEHSEEKSEYAEHVNNNGVCEVCRHGITALINGTEYKTLASAVADVEANETIVLFDDVDLETALEIEKPVTIDLNNKTLSVAQDTEGNGVFWVKEGGNLTINGDGIVNGVGDNKYNIAVFVNGGNLTINGGLYTNKNLAVRPEDTDSSHFDLIYVKGGTVVINGGTFEGYTPAWLLNLRDDMRDSSSITVKGGTFHGFNPADNLTEGQDTNYLAPGYVVSENNNVFTVGAGETVAMVGTTEYCDLQTAINETDSGSTIVLQSDIDLTKGLIIAKQIVLDLNNKTISGQNNTSTALIRVNNGGKLTISGEGTINSASQANDYSMALWASSGGEITINGGTFTNVGGKDFEDDGTTPNNNEMIYANGLNSKITINTGKFVGNYENETWGTRYTLNILDNSGASIIVKGGEFYQFNPAASLSENPQANFVASGYRAYANGDYYTVLAE